MAVFDHPDLVAAVALRKVALFGATGKRKRPLYAQKLRDEMGSLVSVFRDCATSNHLRIELSDSNLTDVIHWMLR